MRIGGRRGLSAVKLIGWAQVTPGEAVVGGGNLVQQRCQQPEEVVGIIRMDIHLRPLWAVSQVQSAGLCNGLDGVVVGRVRSPAVLARARRVVLSNLGKTWWCAARRRGALLGGCPAD